MTLNRLSNCLFTIVATTGLLGAATIRVPGTCPNGSSVTTLQAAHDCASNGDTIVITVDTPGALISKQLTIQGTGAAIVSLALGTGTGTGYSTYGGATYGIGLTSGASGSLIRNVTIDGTISSRPQLGIVTGGFFSSAASNVTVRQCTIIETFQGISGRCDNITGSSCPVEWTVAQNDISLNSSGSSPTGSYIGIVPHNGADTWTVIHNDVTRSAGVVVGQVAGIEVIAISSFTAYGISPPSIKNVSVKQNKVSVLATCGNPLGPCGQSIAVADVVSGGTNDLTTVAYNDLRGSDFPTILTASIEPGIDSNLLDTCTNSPNDDLTGLHQFLFSCYPSGGPITNFTGLGNMDSWSNGNRGSISNSAIRPSGVLPR